MVLDNKLLGMAKKSVTLGMILTAVGCASVDPKTPWGQLNQYSAAGKKVQIMNQGNPENREYGFRLNDLYNAFEDGSINFPKGVEIRLEEDLERGSPEYQKLFVENLREFSPKVVKNAMFRYAANNGKREAIIWRTESGITEPLSLILWFNGSNNNGSNGNNGGNSNGTFGNGSNTVEGGSGAGSGF